MRTCVNCKYLGQCKETTPEQLLAGYTCVRWDAAEIETAEARAAAIRRFGEAGARVLVDPPTKED